MSLRINTNLPAMTALRNLSSSNDAMSQSINRLSTGLRINSAADDPAGLIISEGMRAKLKGISQAIQNSQDAINMSKTAEGALNEVQTLLQNVRSIAVHAANSAVVDNAQLQADQGEINSTIASINRIASSTSWGQKRLLDGTAGVMANITDLTDISGSYFQSSFNGMQIANGPITVTRTTAAAQTALQTNVTYANTSSVVPAGSIVVNGYTYTSNGTSDTLAGMVAKINADSANTGVTASITTVAGPAYELKLTANEYGASYPVNFFDPKGLFHSTPNPTPTTVGVDAVATVQATVVSGTTTSVQSVTFRGGQNPGDSGLRLTDADGNVINLTPTGNAGLAAATGVGVITAGNVRFQIGSDASQAVAFAMPDTRASNLGTSAITGKDFSMIDVTTQAGATEAIKIIDNAVEQLASMRAKLGSFQKNFLESNVRSLNVANENLTSAESTIRDVDMAQEMTQYTKTQILQQSGMAVLAQANQAPQSILKLLQS